MDLDFTPEQEELRDAVRTLLERECPPALVRGVVEGTQTSDDLWKRMVDLDWPALTVPEDSGGMGLGFVELAVVVEELGRVAAPGPLLASVSQFAPVVRETGDEAQRQRFLGPIAAGERSGTLAFAEDQGRWHPASVRTTLAPSGDGWLLDGTKRWVLDEEADDTAVVARLPDTSGDEGIAVAVVPRSMARRQEVQSFDASRTWSTLEFDKVPVDADCVLGEPGAAAPAVLRALDEAVTALALEMLGTCQTIFSVALQYAQDREQFGVPIGTFQAVKHKLADMHVALERARATAYFAAATIAEDDERRTLAASMAKAAAGEAQRVIAQEGIQLLGGIGYTWEHDMHLWVKRVKSGNAVFGTAADHRQRIFELANA